MRSFKQFTAGSLSNQKFNICKTSEELKSIRSEISFNYLAVSLLNAEYYEKVFDRYCYLVSKHL